MNGNSSGGSGSGAGKYVKYTAEQIEALERVYAVRQNPNLMQRQQMIYEFPVLANIECRDKQKKEAFQLQVLNRKLSAINKLLLEENDRLQQQVSQLVYENKYVCQQLKQVSAETADASCEPLGTKSQQSSALTSNTIGLVSLAQETLNEFLPKATGTSIQWVHIPGIKPGPDSLGDITISNSGGGVAVRACSLVCLEPRETVEILKDRPSWFRDCRKFEVFTKFPAGNEGSIELIHMQVYAPTTLAHACDFWTLRYTSCLEDDSLVVCEKSMYGAGPNLSASEFRRAKMLPSGYVVRPCEEGGSTLHIVDHVNLEARSVPEVLRPLYESPKLLAQKMTLAALQHLQHVSQETLSDATHAFVWQPAVLRAFSHKLSRGFNDAINGLSDDGWSLMSDDAADDLIISVNTTNNMFTALNLTKDMSSGGILCVKASMLLHDVPPALLVHFLREHRSEWANNQIDADTTMPYRVGTDALPEFDPTATSGSQTVMPLDSTICNNEILDIIRLEGHSLSHGEDSYCRGICLLQMCTGVGENAVCACSELIFAPISETFPDDALLLSSGFRILLLESDTHDGPSNRLESGGMLDQGSNLQACLATNLSAREKSESNNSRSLLIIAFQFPFRSHLQKDVAIMAQKYVRSLISSVRRIALAISSALPNVGLKPTPCSNESLTQWICQSYSYFVGGELLGLNRRQGDSLPKQLWHYQDAILCCSLKSLPVLIFGNQGGLEMLESTLVALQDITLDKIFKESSHVTLFSSIPNIMQEGFAHLPGGLCMSTKGRYVSYDQAIGWKVLTPNHSVHCLALAFFRWSFL
ncbi:START domain [Dillenia turbinata]|uniref:START domain n=1 Tax=Dillenia turbinata TaxID=194707 RepID=A0AAN8VFW2_9MAGN